MKYGNLRSIGRRRLELLHHTAGGVESGGRRLDCAGRGRRGVGEPVAGRRQEAGHRDERHVAARVGAADTGGHVVGEGKERAAPLPVGGAGEAVDPAAHVIGHPDQQMVLRGRGTGYRFAGTGLHDRHRCQCIGRGHRGRRREGGQAAALDGGAVGHPVLRQLDDHLAVEHRGGTGLGRDRQPSHVVRPDHIPLLVEEVAATIDQRDPVAGSVVECGRPGPHIARRAAEDLDRLIQ